MLRTFYLRAATLAIAVIALVGQSARAQHEHAEHFLKCAKVCADCQLQCDSCFKHCLTLVADGKKEHAKTAQLCGDIPNGVLSLRRTAQARADVVAQVSKLNVGIVTRESRVAQSA